eukprot:3472262-Alexandrium_andersonii.AAC.1
MSCTADVRIVPNIESCPYDAIIGVSTLHKWKVQLDFISKTTVIDGLSHPMKTKDAYRDHNHLMNVYNEALEPHATKQETERA